MFCKNCGKEISDNAAICMHCGAWTTEEQKIEKPKNGMAIAGFVCSFFVPILGWIFGGIGLKKSEALDGKGKGFSIAAIAIATVMFLVYLGIQ